MQAGEALRTHLLREVDAVAPALSEHALESEALGRLAPEAVESLRRTDLFHFTCPRQLGGGEADPWTQIEVLEALARIDGAAAWCVGILAGTTALVGAFLPSAAAQRLFADGVPTAAGMVAPRGRADPVPDGYRVSGRWAFGSGIHHADWVIAGTRVQGESGTAVPRLVVVPRQQVSVHDNWQVAGLKASGSSDYSLDEVFVPEEMSFPMDQLIRGRPTTGGAAFRLGLPGIVAPFHLGIALGIAQRALTEITAQAAEKGRGFPPSPLPGHAHVQAALGRAQLELTSARTLARDVVARLWNEAGAGRVPSPALQAEARGAATYVTELAQRVATAAFQAAGGGALFDTNPLQRCLRDVYAAGQHFVVSHSAYRALGQFALGEAGANPML